MNIINLYGFYSIQCELVTSLNWEYNIEVSMVSWFLTCCLSSNVNTPEIERI